MTTPLDATWTDRGAMLLPSRAIITSAGRNDEAFRRDAYVALRGGWRPPVNEGAGEAVDRLARGTRA